jgi:hypothetical protein
MASKKQLLQFTTAEQQAAEQTYRAIGRFVFEFSQVEYTIRHVLAEELHVSDKHFEAVVGSYDVAMLTTVAIEVFKKSRNQETAAKIEKLLNRFRVLNEDRKRVVHGLWVPFMDGGAVHYVSRNKLASRYSAEQANELEKLADQLCQLRPDLMTACSRTFDFDLPKKAASSEHE